MVDPLERRLRRVGLRVTRPRLAVLDVVMHADSRQHHLSAAEVAERARAKLGTLSTQAVYDCLDALTEAGLLRRIAPAGSSALYEAHNHDNHHHLVCRRCGAIADVECQEGPAPCLNPAEDLGFEVDEAEVIYWGLCPSCADADPGDASVRGHRPRGRPAETAAHGDAARVRRP